jgi:hypothetical protein
MIMIICSENIIIDTRTQSISIRSDKLKIESVSLDLIDLMLLMLLADFLI